MAAQRIYIVRTVDTDGSINDGEGRLVRAPNAAQALRHVVNDTLHVELAQQDDLVSLAAAGVKVEEATTTKEDPQ